MKQHNPYTEASPNLANLTLMERSVWMLAEYEGFSTADIAEITGLSAAEAREVLGAARQKLAPPVKTPLIISMRTFLLRSAAAVLIGAFCYLFWNKNQISDNNAPNVIAQVALNPQKIAEPQNSPEKPLLQNHVNQPAIRQIMPQKKATTVLKTIGQKSVTPDQPLTTVTETTPLPPEKAAPQLSPKTVSIAQLPSNPLSELYPKTDDHSDIAASMPSVALASEDIKSTNNTDKSLQKLRRALIPRAFFQPDERISVTLHFSSVLTPAKDTE